MFLNLSAKEILIVNKINLFLYLACQTVYYGPHCDKICNSSCPKQRFYSDKEDCLQVNPCLTFLLRQVQLLSKNVPSVDQPLNSDNLFRKKPTLFSIRLTSSTSLYDVWEILKNNFYMFVN